MEKQGIKELGEAIDAVLEVALVLAKVLKDGLQLDDARVLFVELNGNEKIAKALEGREKILAEAKDLDLAEGLELASKLLGFIPKMVDCLKK